MANSNYNLASQVTFTEKEVAAGNKAFAGESVNSGTLGTEVAQISGTTIPTLKEKQQQSTDGGCGTSFTTATDPKDISVTHQLNGNYVEVATVNAQGDVQKKWITSAGTSMTFAEDGSVIFTTSKRDGDALSGRFDVTAQGNARLKIGEAFFIEVGNKNSTNADSKGTKTTPKAMSIVVYGNVDIDCKDGELSVKAKNINLNAANELNLSAGSKISLLSGKGKAGNKASGNKEAKVEYGGSVEIQTGDYNLKATTVRKTTSMDYKVVEGEGAIISTSPQSAYGIKSPGHFEMSVSGDYLEEIGGKKRTTISNKSLPIKTMLPGQEEGHLTSIGGNSTGNAMSFIATVGGFEFNTKKGDVIMYTEAGGVVMTSKTTGGFAAIDKDRKGADGKPLGLIPGVYVKGFKQPVYVTTNKDDIVVGVGYSGKGEVTNGISLSKIKMALKNAKGIYLN